MFKIYSLQSVEGEKPCPVYSGQLLGGISKLCLSYSYALQHLSDITTKSGKAGETHTFTFARSRKKGAEIIVVCDDRAIVEDFLSFLAVLYIQNAQKRALIENADVRGFKSRAALIKGAVVIARGGMKTALSRIKVALIVTNDIYEPDLWHRIQYTKLTGILSALSSARSGVGNELRAALISARMHVTQ